ncbi:chemotaxis protein CheW [Crocosphaera sp. UHCC 0190]|uniref:chemotaxis protein CheW n=1 Tax=Crocosphaera sp. UHCC 0190 TaxID=3110246 RepID=UPI002B21ED82|nr:chemotaxis protein CheW [Crocosphaera sp. UHCC 0190]MEA5512201.1 chemotaxis protein CheW [Crocosphaera sp. UHCC 0190]
MNTSINQCWNKIGVYGDSSCPELKTVIHCRNCAIYGAAGRNLLQRQSPEGYVEEWTDLLAQDWQEVASKKALNKQEALTNESLGLIIFRVAQEWLALPVWVVKEITHVFPVHTLPHRSNHVFAGIVNIRGEILMCILLRNLLGLSAIDFRPENKSSQISNYQNHEIIPVIYQRMVVLEIQGNRWVFPVDEILGVYRFSGDQLKDAPVVISKTPDTYTKKILSWQGKQINYLDYELVFYELLFYTLNRA